MYRVLLIPFLVLVAVRSTVAAGTPMRYRWQVNKPVYLRLTAKLTGSLPIMQNPEPVDLEGVLRVTYIATPRRTDSDGNTVIRFEVSEADAEVLGIPVSVPMEDAHKVLDRVVTFAPTGEVVRVEKAPPLPFALSIPGVDPQRLYSLLCPIVFPVELVSAGDEWDYNSMLLGTEDAPARFRARVLQVPSGSQGMARELRMAQEFTMEVNQLLGEDKKPVAQGKEPMLSRNGTIQGNGIMVFDPAAGKLLRGHLTIQANITEKVLQPTATDGPVETVSKVKAVLQIQPDTKPSAAAKASPSKKGGRTVAAPHRRRGK